MWGRGTGMVNSGKRASLFPRLGSAGLTRTGKGMYSEVSTVFSQYLNHISFLSSISVEFRERLATPYPPIDTWMAESQETLNLWSDMINRKKRHDNRPKPRILMDVVDRTQVFTVPADRSMIIRDRLTGKIVMVVIRNFVGDSTLLKYIDTIVQASVDFRKSTRVSVMFFHCILTLILVSAWWSRLPRSDWIIGWIAQSPIYQLGQEHTGQVPLR